MSLYQNKDNTLNRFGSNIKFKSDNVEQYVTETELVEALAEKQDIIQYDVLPSANAENLGKIIQYVGEDTANYKNGLFYKCVSDGAITPTYSWVKIDVVDFPWITPQDYGAVGDGVTDDSEAVVQAFTEANTTGKTLYFPTGSYLIDWGRVSLNVGAKGLNVIGDGKFKSIIKLKDSHNDGNNGNGIALIQWNTSISKPDVLFSKIGITYDNNDSSIVTFPYSSSLIRMVGDYNKLLFDDMYFHIGGSAELPNDTCFFGQMGAKTMSVTNCLFENFTNKTVGGGLWIMSSGGSSVIYEIGQVNIRGNEFRTTNKDEAIAVYTHGDDTQNNLRNVLITDNIITHKNWNGVCSYTNGIIAVFIGNSTVNPVDGNIVISNNVIYSEKTRQDVIRVSRFKGVKISDNKIKVDSIATEQTDVANTIILYDCTGLISGNMMDYSNITHDIGITQQNSDVEWDNNIISAQGKIFVTGNRTTDIMTLKSNVINLLGNSATSKLIFNSINNEFYLFDNIVNGVVEFGNYSVSNMSLKHNHFDYRTGNVSSIDLRASNFDGEYNDGVVINLKDNLISTPMASFKYIGKKDGLRFFINSVQVEDSQSVRDTFFNECDIVYIDAPTIDGVITEPVYDEVDTEYLHMGYYVRYASGNLSELEGTGYYEIVVQEGEKYRVVGNIGYQIALYAFYDDNGNFISAYPTSSAGIRFETKDIVIPSGVAILRCSGYCSSESNTDGLYLYKNIGKKYKIVNKGDVLYGKKWVACGDSFTQSGLGSYTDSEGIGTHSGAFDKLDGVWKTYPYWIKKRTGINADWQTCALAGSTFTNKSGAIRPFSADTSSPNYTMIPADADIVTLAYGLNEINLTAEQIGQAGDTTNETLFGAYHVVINSILANNPKAKIGIIINDSWMNQSYHDALVDVAKYYGIPYLDLKNGTEVPMGISGRLDSCDPDSVALRNAEFKQSDNHPTLAAQEYRSTFIENFLRSL